MEKVLANESFSFGYNAATGAYEDLMAAGIIDPTKVWVVFLCCYVEELIAIETLNLKALTTCSSADINSLFFSGFVGVIKISGYEL